MTLSGIVKNLFHQKDNSSKHSHPPSHSATPTQRSQAQSAGASSASPPQPTLSQPEPAHLAHHTATHDQPAAPASAAADMPSSSQTAITGSASRHEEQAEAVVRREAEIKAKRDATAPEGLPSNLSLGKKMGDGAFSNVYEATLRPSPAQLALDPNLNKSVKVAVKCVRKFELNSSQQAQGKHVGEAVKKKPRATERANILKEVQIMRGLNHPSIVRLLDFTESREHYYLTLELMAGGELFHQIVKLTYFSEELSRHVILQVAQGIRYLHEEKGVVHRDIKPENILFEAIPIIPSKHPKHRPYDEEKEDEGEFIPGVGGGGIGRVKIADFGLSKVVWSAETMTPCGTVGYTAPEIVKDERYSKSVDLWALGCVLYTLLCGFPPFYDESIHVLTEKVAKGYYTFLSPWWDDISASSKDLITHLLDVDPEKRYTIDEFLAHPWCRTKPNPSAVTPGTLEQLAPGLKPVPKYMPMDSPLLAPGGRRAMPSPGIATLKEAFDVTYAVHRMEEEDKQRNRGAGGRGFLQGLNEEDEEDEEADLRKYGASVTQAIQQKRRDLQDPLKPQQAQQSAAEQQRAAQAYQGWGGADRRQAEAALYGDGRAGVRDRGTRGRRGGGAGFDLKLDNATLLGRRKVPLGDNAPSPMKLG
ncbi:hypothetical protein JCM10207_000734 [Rhodosporidiobolus poonsookiae]